MDVAVLGGGVVENVGGNLIKGFGVEIWLKKKKDFAVPEWRLPPTFYGRIHPPGVEPHSYRTGVALLIGILLGLVLATVELPLTVVWTGVRWRNRDSKARRAKSGTNQHRA